MLDSDEEDSAPKNPYYQKRPVCGASIGAYLPDEGHMLPVSFGGIVHVDDKPYGLTVHHMLEPLSDDEADEEDEDEESAMGGASDDESEDESSSDLDAIEANDEAYLSSDFESDLSDDEFAADPTTSQSPSNFSSKPPSESSSKSPSHFSTTGDTQGYPVDSTRAIQITQPALIDAVSTGWHLTNIDQASQDSDHLLSFALGRVHASSGLRRARHDDDLVHEIDWALLELHPPRLQPHNLVLGGRRYCTTKPAFCPPLESPVLRSPISDAPEFDAPEVSYPVEQDLYPCSIMPISSLPNTPVLSFGRTSGLSTGRISAAMSFVKIAGRTTFSHSWNVVGDFGVGGDSGAWVVDAKQGRVAGHVLAEQRGVTYFCPMEVLVSDIKTTLAAERVRLPGDEVFDTITEEAGPSVNDKIPTGHVKADSVVSTAESAGRTRRQRDRPVKAAVQSQVSECRLSSQFAVA